MNDFTVSRVNICGIRKGQKKVNATVSILQRPREKIVIEFAIFEGSNTDTVEVNCFFYFPQIRQKKMFYIELLIARNK